MKNFPALTFCAALLLVFSGKAHALQVLSLQVSRAGDLDMGCGQLSREAVLMRDIVVATEDIQEDAEIQEHGITAAGAVGSLLIGTATGGVGLAAAGFLLNHVNGEKAEQAGGVQDTAEQRRALMMGIYNAKGCFGPLDHALQDGLFRPERVIQIAAVEPAGGEDGNRQDRPAPQYND